MGWLQLLGRMFVLIWAMFISVKEVSGSLNPPGLACEAGGGHKLCLLLLLGDCGTRFLFNFRFT